MNKKFLPFLIVGVVALLFIGGVMIIRNNNANSGVIEEEDQNIPDLPEGQRPTLGLVPTTDGYYLGLKVSSIKVDGAASMDYELLWKANNGGTETTQGTSSTIKLNGQTDVTKDLLLGSESNGKFRYDQGVETGTLTLRFRNGQGKMIGKLMTDWHLQTGSTTLTSVDNSFKYTLDKSATGVYFVTMKSFNEPTGANVVKYTAPYAVYSSDGKPHTGN